MSARPQSKKDKKAERKLQKAREREYLSYHAAAVGVDEKLGRRKQLEALRTMEKNQDASNRTYSVVMQVACAQMAVWWPCIIAMLDLDAALRLVCIPLSLFPFALLSVLVSYAMVTYQPDRANPEVKWPIYPALWVWSVHQSLAWNTRRAPVRLFVTQVVAVVVVAVMAWYDGGRTIAQFNAGERTGFSAVILTAIPMLFVAFGAVILMVVLPFVAVRANAISALSVYIVHLAIELVLFGVWSAWEINTFVLSSAAASSAVAGDSADLSL